MRPPSASLMSALHALHVRPEPDAPHEWAYAIDEVAKQNHPAIALALAPLVLVPDAMIANTAVRALHRVLLRLDEKGILWIAREGRRFDFTRSLSPYSWRMLRHDDLPRFDAFGDDAVGLYCIGSVHSSGRVREACVERLAKYRGALPTAFLFVRLNDWVGLVRDRARAAVLEWLSEIQCGDTVRCQELLDNIMLTEYLDTWGREDHVPVREAIESALAQNPLVWLLDRPRDGSSFARLLRLHKYNLQQCEAEPFEFLQRTLSSRSQRLRLWAAREITKRLSGEELRTLVDVMQKDSFHMVRYEAVFALATKISPLNQSTLIPFSHDPNPEVRFLACYYLEKYHFDFRAHYLEVLPRASGSELVAIIIGIGERGKPGDETAIVSFGNHPDPLVRRAFVFTTGKLRRDDDLSWIFEALGDPHKLVVREAARQIEARIHVVDPPVIEKWFQSDPRLSMRRAALRIGAKMERWEALGFLLRAAWIPDMTIRRDVERELDRWCRGFLSWYARPKLGQLARLEQAYANVSLVIDTNLSERIARKLAEQRKR